jgi:hypothetical protein
VYYRKAASVQFLWAKGLNAKDIHEEVFPVYCGKSWIEKFSQGRSEVTDDAQPGRPVEIATEATVPWIKELILADRRIMIDSVATALGCSHDLAYGIMHDCLEFLKVCAWRLPRELKD